MALGWQPSPESGEPVEVDAYVGELHLGDLVERHRLEPAPDGPVCLRATPEPWPFPPQQRLAPAVVVALDLAESGLEVLRQLGRARLIDAAPAVAPTWRPPPARKPPLEPILPPAAPPTSATTTTRPGPAPEVCDDRVEGDARALVGLLFVVGAALRRTDALARLRLSPSRLARAVAFLQAAPPFGLSLVDTGEALGLATAPAAGTAIERALEVPKPERLSQAALTVLAIVAYEQPVTRADIARLRLADSDSIVAGLLARGLLAEDRRFAVRGGPVPLVTTDAFLRYLGLRSLADLPPLPAAGNPPH
jgi:segregation and condensation protein B